MAEKEEKPTEKCQKAQKKFIDKAFKITASLQRERDIRELAEQIVAEYNKVFGRVGQQPLLFMKGGKKRPRYLVDRDEVWVLYKPPLWQMGGNPERWKEALRDRTRQSNSLAEAQQSYMESGKVECLQEWHGLCQGVKWIEDRPDTKGPTEFGFIQRLDLETDGPVIVAKTWRAQRFLQVQLGAHIFSKAYMCLVHGKMENKIWHLKCRFAELGGGAESTVMVKHDSYNDPFYRTRENNWWKERYNREADTFWKPIAYYQKDGVDYSLVYVNILSGITHQVRITMQSVGHPLVSDDRYLPRDQALKDLQWCPRNFLCEVRQDWFDMCGPHRDTKRKMVTRISIENPLPKLFQDVLTNKLTLVEKLDPGADLFQGCTYWAIGDEQLMLDYQKDSEYRKKVMRWGQRRGIHLDAMDRLLLLKREEIDRVLSEWKPPEEDEENWVCPKCMQLHLKRHGEAVEECRGAAGRECGTARKVDEDTKPSHGFKDYFNEPTINLLVQINPLWLEARRNALKRRRPVWEKAPDEEEGDMATEEQVAALQALLVKDAEAGNHGISQLDLAEVPLFKGVKMPMRLPQDCTVRRCRLPGRGTDSAWTYSLNGKEKLRVSGLFSVKGPMLLKPITVNTEKLPFKNIKSKEEQEKEWQEQREQEEWAAVRAEKERKKQEDLEEEGRKRKQKAAAREKEAALREEQEKKKPKKKRNWKRTESTKNPGTFVYVDADTGEVRSTMPPDYEEPPPVWEKVESTSNRGSFYYHNRETGESRAERPKGVKIINEDDKGKQAAGDGGIAWQRIPSKSKPGHFYYFNPSTGANEIKPPRVKPPWQLLESKSNKGAFYYFNEVTGENREHPPSCAVSASQEAKSSSSSTKANSASGSQRLLPAGDVQGLVLPKDWERRESSQHVGKYYYINTKTQETRWTKPVWEKVLSSSHAGKAYYRHVDTGETTWDQAKAEGA